MKAKLIYKKGSSYFGGINPYNEKWETVIEVDGRYYEIYEWGNYTNSGKSIAEIELDLANIPEEYSRTDEDEKTKYSLTHGNGREIEIDITSFDTEYEGKDIPEGLRGKYQEEILALKRAEIEKKIKEDPSLDYHTILDSAELTEEQRKIAELIISKMEQELFYDKYLELSDYRPIIENIVSIAKGESVIVTHTNASCSRPDDNLILISNLQKGYPITLATSGLHWEHAWGKRATIPYVFSLQGKKIKLEDGTSYLGSYWKQGYSIDMMLNKEGIPYIERNVYESWANSQYYKGIIDTKLPVDRFDIDTGEEGSFKEYNDEVHQVREKREAYCRKVIRQARKQFNISEEQAKILLKFAGTANILSLATRFEREGLTTEQALVMLRKNSHAGMESVLAKAGIEYPENKHFDDIQDAARTVAYIHTLQGEKSGPYTVAQIRKVISPRQGEMNSVLNETIKGARTPNSKDKTKTDNEGAR